MSQSLTEIQSTTADIHGEHVAVRTPRTFSGPWSEARTLAASADEPVFVPVSPYADDRGWSIMNLLTGVMTEQGQMNFSMQYPTVVKAWHRHRLQTDFWICLTGNLKTGVYRESDNTAWLLCIGERRPGVLIIPPGLWHGAAAIGGTPAGLMYYVTHAYDSANPDEERRPFDSVAGFPWNTRHG